MFIDMALFNFDMIVLKFFFQVFLKGFLEFSALTRLPSAIVVRHFYLLDKCVFLFHTSSSELRKSTVLSS